MLSYTVHMDTIYQHKLLPILLTPLCSCTKLLQCRATAANFEEERLVEIMSDSEGSKEAVGVRSSEKCNQRIFWQLSGSSAIGKQASFPAPVMDI